MPSKPTAIASKKTSKAVLAPVNTGAIVLQPDQQQFVQTTVASLDFAAMPSGDMIQLGLGAEQDLHKTLDGFLARLDKSTAAQVFKLFKSLEQGVEDAKLPEILERVQYGNKPNIFAQIFGAIQGKSRDEVIQDLMGEVGDMIAGRTKTLADEMGRLEGELKKEMQKLYTELQVLNALKQAYSKHFLDFTAQAAIANAFLEKARTYVDTEASKVQPNDMVAQTRVDELQNKLRLLESRALALEGTYTRLPADHLVIQQIEEAGISTLQETTTTIAGRFASIKMTLLAIHGAFAVGNVQQISERQAALDRQLTDLRAKALKQVATTAASAPGENRLAQAEQVKKIIESTREIHELIAVARQATDEKFEIARQTFAEARQALVELRAQS